MNNKMRPALIGGVVLGVLSALPFISAVNACCCAWAIAGGLLGSYLYVKQSAAPASPGDGAAVGVIAGLIGAVIYVVVGLPLGLLTGNATIGMMGGLVERMGPEAAEAFRKQVEMMQNQSTAEQLVAAIPTALIGSVLLVIFSTIGGLLGVVLFEKRKGAGTPPPPPGPAGYGGQPPQQPGAGYGGYGSGA